jgi:hypothetical protein
MPLRITDAQKDAPKINKWAHGVESDISDLREQSLQHYNATKAIAKQVTAVIPVNPNNPTGVSGSSAPVTIDGQIYCQVTVNYTAPNPIGSFAGVFLAVAGYNGSSQLVKVSEDNFTGAGGGSHSFVTILNRTNETITCYAVPKNNAEGTIVTWTAAPSFTVTLSGSVAAPAAPTGLAVTAQPLANTLAWTNNTEANVKGYTVYRNTSNTFGSATKIGTVPWISGGSPSYPDKAVTVGTTYFYWVTATNNSTLESANSSSVSAKTLAGLIDFSDNFHLQQQVMGQTVSLVGGSGLTTSVEGAPPQPLANYIIQSTVSLPGTFHAMILANGGLIEFLFYASTGASGPNGYFFRFDSRITQYPGQILIVNNGTWSNIGTAKGAVNSANLTDWHRVDFRVSGSQYDIWVDGVWQYTATDATYTPTGAVYTSAAVVTPVEFAPLQVHYSGSGRALHALDSRNQVAGGTTVKPVVASGAYTGANPLSQSGTTTTINVAASTIQWGTKSVSYNSGSVSPVGYGTKYVYADDPGFTGGAVTYQSSNTALTLISNDARVPFGNITTAIGGGGIGGGGAPGTCFSSNTKVKTQRGNVPFSELEAGDFVLTARGTWRRILYVVTSEYAGVMLEMPNSELVTPGHRFLFEGKWIRADELQLFPTTVDYDGLIHNLSIEGSDDGSQADTERSYTLANGHVVHNIMPTT